MKLLIALLLGASAHAAPSGELISKTVGRVKDHIITSREVQINYLIENSLYRPKKNSKLEPLKLKGRVFLREVTAVLLEWTVHMEAKSFAAANVTVKELSAAKKTILRRAQRIPEWKSLGVNEQELRNMIQRKLQAKKFIRFKVDSASVPITDSEAKAYFDGHRMQFGNLPFENFKSNIKAFLGRKQVDQRLKDWFEVLQAKYAVRNFLSDL